MPIIGLTDKAASFPRLGELRKGAAKPATGNRPGADLNDKFRFTSKIDGMEKLFFEEFGGTPNNVLCYLPYQTTDENFPAWVEEWAAGGLKWRGDGVNLVLWQKEDGTYSTDTKPQPVGGKGSAKLHLIIPALKRMGYVVALTTSLNDMIEISANLRAYESMRGDLRGIPFILSRVPRMISTPSGSDGTRARREKWLMHLEIVPDYTAAQLEATARAAMPQLVSSSMPALASGESLDTETGEIVADEVIELKSGRRFVTDEHDEPHWDDAPPFVPESFDEPEPEAAATGDNGERAAILISDLQDKAKKSDKPASTKQIKLMMQTLGELCDSEKMKRSIMMYIFNLASGKDATGGMASAIIEWGGLPDNGWKAMPESISQAQAIYTAAKIHEGQLELM